MCVCRGRVLAARLTPQRVKKLALWHVHLRKKNGSSLKQVPKQTPKKNLDYRFVICRRRRLPMQNLEEGAMMISHNA